MIAINCPDCDGKLILKDEMAGRPFTCPDCATEFHVPSADEDDPPAPSAVRALVNALGRRWELLGCMAVGLALAAFALRSSDMVLVMLMPWLIGSTIGYAAFYRRLVHPFAGFVSILLLAIVSAKVMEKKAGNPLAALGGGMGGLGGGVSNSGDAMKLIQDATKNLREASKLVDELTEGK